MYYELALISVVVAGGYWGFYFVRVRPTGSLTFGLMQLGAALAAALGLLARQLDDPPAVLGAIGAIGVGAGILLLVVGPVIRGAARRAAGAERLRLARRLLDVAEVLAPGAGVTQDKAMLGAMLEIREGRIDRTIDALNAAKHAAPADARRAIDERIAMLYFAAYRWDDAIAHAEAALFDAARPAATLDKTASPNGGAVARDQSTAPVAVKRAVGVAAPVWIEMLGAYARTGDLEQSARMLGLLEDVCADRDDAAILLHRARTMFLALAGRIAAVQALVAPRIAHHMSVAARSYWVAVAHAQAGDTAGAVAAYRRAQARTRPGRPRQVIDEALATLGAIDAAVAVELGELATAMVTRVEAAPLPKPPRPRRPQRAWATIGLTAAVVAVAGAIALGIGDSTDIGVLTRAGAMVRGLVAVGQWWRLVACVFIHVGGLHLLVNATGLWFVGRLAEDVFGGARTLVIFAVAGIAGAVASYLASAAGVSAGASGAIFGLLGAVLIELTLHRGVYRHAWRRGVWGSLAVVTVAQVAVGFLYPGIDQWAHGGGLLTGAVAGIALSPQVPWSRWAGYAARGLAAGFVALGVVVAVLAARTDLATDLAAPAHARRTIDTPTGAVALDAPMAWTAELGAISDPDLSIVLTAMRARGTRGLATELAAWKAGESTRAKELGFDEVVAAPDHLLALPAGWDGTELAVAARDPADGEQRFRAVVAGRVVGDDVVIVSLYAPLTMVRVDPGYFTQLIASVQPVGPVIVPAPPPGR